MLLSPVKANASEGQRQFSVLENSSNELSLSGHCLVGGRVGGQHVGIIRPSTSVRRRCKTTVRKCKYFLERRMHTQMHGKAVLTSQQGLLFGGGGCLIIPQRRTHTAPTSFEFHNRRHKRRQEREKESRLAQKHFTTYLVFVNKYSRQKKNDKCHKR